MNGVKGYQNVIKSTGNSAVYNPTSSILTSPLTDKYTIGEDIGRGKFAVVRKCTNVDTGEVLAAKFIKKRRRGKSCREEILREVVMLEMALDHPRLVNLKEVYETQQELILITEYCAGGELFTECILEEKFNESDVRGLMAQILEGLVYLHERNIVHLDLKPQNILLTEAYPKGSIKICDLGFACLVKEEEDIRDIIGTPDYVAPEVLNYDPLGLYTDMWSLGVLTYVMLTTCSPFAGEDKQETFCNITTVNLDFPEDLFANISDNAVDFIKKLLIADSSERMTAKDCLQHPWLADLFPSSGEALLTPGLKDLGFEQRLDAGLAQYTSNNWRDKIENQASEMSVTEVKDDGAETALSDDETSPCIGSRAGITDGINLQVRTEDIVTPDSGIDDTFECKLRNEHEHSVTPDRTESPRHSESVANEEGGSIGEKADSLADVSEASELKTNSPGQGDVEEEKTNEEFDISDEDMLSCSGVLETEQSDHSDNALKELHSDHSAGNHKIPDIDSSVTETPHENVVTCNEVHLTADDNHSFMEHSGIEERITETVNLKPCIKSENKTVNPPSDTLNNSDKQNAPFACENYKLNLEQPSVSGNSITTGRSPMLGRRSFGGFMKGEEGDGPSHSSKGRHSTGSAESENLSHPGVEKANQDPNPDEAYEFVPVSKRVRSYEDSLSPTSPKIPRSPMVNRQARHKPH